MEQEQQPRRKNRIPLSSEELYYLKKIKELKKIKHIEEFKKTKFYQIINRINIILACFLSYTLFTILFFCHWQTATISKVNCFYGDKNPKTLLRAVKEFTVTTTNGDVIPVKSNALFRTPAELETFFIGKDLLFRKILKIRLIDQHQSFWHINTYPKLSLCIFSLCLGFLIYVVNKHLTVNGLLTVFGLFTLTSLYFVTV